MDLQIIIILLLVGLGAGMLSGMVGVGGGIIIVPCLVYFLGFSQKMAQGTSLGLLLLPVGILGALQFYKAGYIDVRVVLIIAAAFIAGSYFGSRWALALPQDSIKKIFALMMLLISIKMLFIDKKTPDSSQRSVSTGKPAQPPGRSS